MANCLESKDSILLLVLLLYCLIFLHLLTQSYKIRRYRGHVNKQYKIESCLTNSDAYVVSGSEDKTIRFWDLVEVNPTKSHTILSRSLVSYSCVATLWNVSERKVKREMMWVRSHMALWAWSVGSKAISLGIVIVGSRSFRARRGEREREREKLGQPFCIANSF